MLVRDEQTSMQIAILSDPASGLKKSKVCVRDLKP